MTVPTTVPRRSSNGPQQYLSRPNTYFAGIDHCSPPSVSAATLASRLPSSPQLLPTLSYINLLILLEFLVDSGKSELPQHLNLSLWEGLTVVYVAPCLVLKPTCLMYICTMFVHWASKIRLLFFPSVIEGRACLMTQLKPPAITKRF